MLDTENSTYLHSSHWGMLLPSSRAACPDVEEIMLLFDYSRIYTGIWGLKRISLSFVLILAVISSHTMASSMNSGTRKKASKRCQYFILYGHCYCFALEQNLCRKKNPTNYFSMIKKLSYSSILPQSPHCKENQNGKTV